MYMNVNRTGVADANNQPNCIVSTLKRISAHNTE